MKKLEIITSKERIYLDDIFSGGSIETILSAIKDIEQVIAGRKHRFELDYEYSYDDGQKVCYLYIFREETDDELDIRIKREKELIAKAELVKQKKALDEYNQYLKLKEKYEKAVELDGAN